MLRDAAGLDSLLLVVSPQPTPPNISSVPSNADSRKRHQPSIPSEPFEASWIGGTDLGKEFWMGLKGGGVNGARAFRVKCQMRRDAELCSPGMEPSTVATSSTCLHPTPIPTSSDGLPMTKMRSGDVKTELNAAVRHALRYKLFSVSYRNVLLKCGLDRLVVTPQQKCVGQNLLLWRNHITFDWLVGHPTLTCVIRQTTA